MGCNGILLAKGQVKEQDGYAPFSILLAIEFGAGVHFNQTKNPLVGSKFPYGVGTFPLMTICGGTGTKRNKNGCLRMV